MKFLLPPIEIFFSVSLQPFDFDPNEKSKHKFMVQSLVAPTADDLNLDTLVCLHIFLRLNDALVLLIALN